jgi:hypothetical protein
MPQQDKEARRRQDEQADAEIQRITVTIDKLKVDLPADKRGELDNLKQAIQSLVTHYKQQGEASQLPYDPNNPQAGQELPAQPGQAPKPGQGLPPTAEPKR